jgi:hypothetical protein
MNALYSTLRSGRNLISAGHYNHWDSTPIPERRLVLPSPLGPDAPWSPVGYAAYRVLASRDPRASSLCRSSWDVLAPTGLPEQWDAQGGVPEGMSVRGLLLLAACQSPLLLSSEGPGQGSLLGRLWTANFREDHQADRMALVNAALSTAQLLWQAPRFTDRQKHHLGWALTDRLLKDVLPASDHWAGALALARHWPQGNTWDAIWGKQATPLLVSARRETRANVVCETAEPLGVARRRCRP